MSSASTVGCDAIECIEGVLMNPWIAHLENQDLKWIVDQGLIEQDFTPQALERSSR